MKTTLIKAIGIFFVILISQNISILNAQTTFTKSSVNKITLVKDLNITIPTRDILESDENTIKVEYSFSAFTRTQISRNNQAFDYLHIKGFSKMSDIGFPALPAHNDIILIPTTGNATITYTAGEYEEFDGFNIHPTLDAASDQEGKPEPEFIMNEIYQQNTFFPQSLVIISEIQKIREQQIAIVQIRPIQFNPVTHKIRVYKNIKYQINYSGEKNSFKQMSSKNSQSYLNTIKGTYINGNIIPKYSTAKSNSSEYLIITTTSFKAAADSLAMWRMQLGYNPVIITKSTWTATEVKDTIFNRYTNSVVHPDYFVIIGDQEQVPSQVFYYNPTQNYGSDLYYACMNGVGDYVPEMAHGRISVTSAEQAMIVVQKIVNYERNPINDQSFYNSAMTCAYFQDGTYYSNPFNNYDDRRFVHTSEEVRNYLITKGYGVTRVYEAFDNRNPLYYNSGYYSNGESLPSDLLKSNGFLWNGSTGDVMSGINAGKFLVMHRDHGYVGGYGWAHPQMVNIYQHINLLSNGNKLPVIMSLNCYTGDFLQSECFAENFIRKADGGAVGIFAHSCESFSGYNDALAIGLVDAIWASPGLTGTFGPGAGTTNPILNVHTNIRTMGDVLNQGLIRMMATWTSPVKWKLQHEIFHYFGDPAMKIWTQNPTEILANIPDSLPRFTSNLIVTSPNCSDGLVTLIVNGELIAKTNLINGTVSIPISYQSNINATITISKEDYRPYTKNIKIRNEIINTKPTQQATSIQIM